MTRSLRTGFPIRNVLLHESTTPSSFSNTIPSLDTWFDRRESCAYLRLRSHGFAEHAVRSFGPTAEQWRACTTVRRRVPHESSQHRYSTTSLGWVASIHVAPEFERDSRNLLNRFHVDDLLLRGSIAENHVRTSGCVLLVLSSMRSGLLDQQLSSGEHVPPSVAGFHMNLANTDIPLRPWVGWLQYM